MGVGGMAGEAVEEVSVEVERGVAVGTTGAIGGIMSRALPFISNACPGDRRDAYAVARMAADALLRSGKRRCRLTIVTAAASEQHQRENKQKKLH